MNNDKMNINLAPGMNEIIIREGAAPKVLDPKAPVKMNINGTIGAPVEFLKKRNQKLDEMENKRRRLRYEENRKNAVTYEEYLKLKSGGKLPQTPNKAI